MTAKLEPTFEGDFISNAPLRLAGGATLPTVTQHYAIYGDVAPARDNVLLVCHALSGSARVFDWWPQLFGPGLPFDLSRFAVVGVNVLGSCYGSTGPTSTDPATGQAYGAAFPVVSIHDMVRAQARLLDHLGIDRPYAVIGGSIGGMQAMAWAAEFPDRVPRCVAIGASPLSAMGLAMSHLQRQAIQLDPAWQGGGYSAQPERGLALARALAMCTYKSAELLDQRYARNHDRNGEDPSRDVAGRFDVGGYLDYQGRIFHRRFDANSYLAISRAMDLFELGRTPAEEGRALGRIKGRVLLVGIRSDWLFPPGDVRALAERMVEAGVEARYAEIDSSHGHDGFLADAADLGPMMLATLEEEAVSIAG